MIVLVRDGADLEMSNGSVRLSRHGRARIAYALGPRDRAHMIAGLEAAARIQLAAGATEVHTLHTTPCVIRSEQDVARVRTLRFAANDLTIFSAHVNGSCRMGTDRRRSAVAPDGERHGVRGLYVADGSLLPTGLGVNPQATIMAMATVVAERMVAEERA
jgi:choline dehydrogenase-like flavoprotein